MVRKIAREKFKCSRCQLIMWSKEALRKHIDKSQHKKAKIIRFSELELCPFVFPQERIICNCSLCIPTLENGQAQCPCLIDKPNLLERYRFMDIEPGIYIGKIDLLEITDNRIKIVLMSDGKRYLLNGPKTIAFEIMKRTVSHDLSKYADNIEGSQRVWNGFQFISDKQDKMKFLFEKIINAEFKFSFEIKSGGIIGDVRRID